MHRPTILVCCYLYSLLSIVSVSAAPVINEFLANNRGGLRDRDGETSDWIEIYHAGPEPVSLLGHTLTDDPERPDKWTFPEITLTPGTYLIVFASGKDLLEGEELHTNFRLGETDYLALRTPMGEVLSAFAPTYPEQFENVAYGTSQSGRRVVTPLISGPTPGKVMVPTQTLGDAWTEGTFDDAAWPSAITGVGYENGSGYEGLLGSGGNLVSQLFGQRSSLYLRVPFEVRDLSQLSALELRMKYDDGFAAWINGHLIASENAPTAPQWDSEATSSHDDSSASQFQTFEASAAIPRLRLGTNILAIQGLNVNNDSSDMLIVPEMDAVRVEDVETGVVGYLQTPTPGAINGLSFEGFVKDTKFSVDRGFFTEPFEVAITTATEGATIRYTIDGSTPTADTGTPYTAPIAIGETTTLRAAAFQEGLVATNVDTVTYLFLEDVVHQSSNGTPPEGWPSNGTVGSQFLDYGMDPDVVSGVHSPPEVVASLEALPTLSIVTDVDHLVGAAEGIYTHAGNDGRAWERPTSLELLHPDGSEGFQIDAGLRIRGGFSRSNNNPKHSFRLFFRREYGEGKLRYPMFGDEGADAFDNLDLRTSQNYSWAFQGDGRNTMVRDVFSRDLQGRMGHPYTRSRYYHLYLNGQYWGLYQSQERSEASFAETYMGGTQEDYDVIKSYGAVTDGTRDRHSELWAEASAGFASDARYWRVQGRNPDGTVNANFPHLLNVSNLIDYMILTYYTGDRDGPGSRFTQPNPNNFYAIINRVNPEGFFYFEHDSEHALDTGDFDMTFPFTTGSGENQFNPHWLHEQLVANAHYRQQFAEHVYRHLFNGGLLTPDNAVAQVNRRAAQIDQAIIAESARWGDAQRATPYTRDDWLAAVESTRRWVQTRREILLEQLQAREWIDPVTPPAFTLTPGPVPSGSRLQFRSSEGEIVYTMDGTDPQSSAMAAIASPAGEIVTPLVRETHPATALVPLGSTLGDSWHQLGFSDAAWQQGQNGVGYDQGNDYRSFISLDVDSTMNDQNASVYVRIPFDVVDTRFAKLTLSMRYDDGFVAYLNGTRVAAANAPGALAWNAEATGTHDDSAAITFIPFDISAHRQHLREGANLLAIHGLNAGLGSSDMLISARLEGSETSGGTIITLPEGEVVVKARVRRGNEWSPLSEGLFRVGRTAASGANLTLTEIMYHPAEPSEEETALGYRKGDFEYLELYNRSTSTIDLSGLTFFRGIDFTFADGAHLVPGARGLLASNPDAFAMRYGAGLPLLGTFEGSLDDSGERLALARSWDDLLIDLRYRDDAPWPESADGSGRSLVLVNPDDTMDLSMSESWLASLSATGAPGLADPGTTEIPDPDPDPAPLSPYDAWKARLGVDLDQGDPDHDGLSNLLEYAFGLAPHVPSTLDFTLTKTPTALILEHPHSSEASDLDIRVQGSDDLITWRTLPLTADKITTLDDRRVYRIDDSDVLYLRLHLEVMED